MNIYSLINTIRSKGILLWQEDGQLKLKAPKGVITEEIRDQITAKKADIIAFLNQVEAMKRVPAILPATRDKTNGQALSYAQESLWIIQQLDPENASYNIPLAFSVYGKLDIPLLNKAFNTVIDRHQILRTVFQKEDGVAQQKILDKLEFVLEAIDLSQVKGKSHAYQEAKRLCEKEASLPFNLAKGPLIRGKLIKIEEQEHIFMLNIHHIIGDDWSINVLLNELFSIIDRGQKNKQDNLPVLPIQYLDYTIWQREWLKQEKILNQQLTYWQQKLHGVQQTLDLTTDYPRPNVQCFNGASQTFTIDATLVSQLKTIAEQQGSTLYMALLAVFKILLYRYTGQEDICIGSVISNRKQEEIQGLIGLFVNTLALRTSISATDTFMDVLSKVKTTCVEAYEHQDAPFEKVVGALNCKRNLAVNPLFQIMVSQNIPLKMPKDTIKPFQLDRHSSKFDMTVEFTETETELHGVIEYGTKLFKQETIERIITNFITLCASVVVKANEEIVHLNLLRKEEQQQLVVDFNQTDFVYPKEKCLHQLFIEKVKSDPKKIALVFENEQLSYQQLFDKSYMLALYLQSLGVKPEALVGICVERSADMLISLLGVLLAGGAYVPLDPGYPDDRLSYMLEDSKLSIIITQEGLQNKVTSLVKRNENIEVILIDGHWQQIRQNVTSLKRKKTELYNYVKTSNLAYVIYTSGSTGKPKGVMVTHAALVNFLCSMAVKPGIKPVDKLLAVTTYCFDIAGLEFYLPLISGAQLRICKSEDAKDAASLKKVIKQYQPTIMQATPATWQFLFYSGWRNEGKLKILVGGEPLPETLQKEFAATNSEAWNMYGPTETTIWSTTQPIIGHERITIGSPIGNTQIYILDAFNNLQPIGVPGELHIAGEGLARGYLNRPELTQEKFVPNPFRPNTLMYKTGDRARWLDNQTIECFGRIDTQVKIRGFRIEMDEVKSILNEYAQIKECAVVAHGNGTNKKLVAYYVTTTTTEHNLVWISKEKLIAHLQKFLPDYMLPTVFVSMHSIPLTQNGKVDLLSLQNKEIDVVIEQDHISVTDKESKILDIWARALELKPESIRVDDNFFDVGGNSVSAVSVAANIEKTLSHKFSPIDLFKYSTIRSIHHYIQGNKGLETTAPIVRTTPNAQENQMTQGDLPRYYEDSLAIIGISCHFPQAEDHWQFWKNLMDGRESINLLSRDELEKYNIAQETQNDPNFVPLKPWLEGKEFFDPEFFQLSYGNAALMDPQFRQLLMHSWKAVEDAGYHCKEIEKTSVFVAASNNFYQSLATKLSSEAHIMENSEEFVAWMLSQGGTIPTMISYQLGLKGPSAFVHSNCSSSLTGLYYAYQSLQSRDADYALVGAATLSASLNLGYMQMPGMNFSSDGHCKTFDARADGMVDGEGVGVMLVKRAIDAINDGDHIYCLVRGLGINNDGADKAGFYAPGMAGQTAVILDTLEKTQINPETISYVEAHGTGTALGDPIEVRAISEAYEKHTDKKQFCAIGSVKPNIGHLDTAAGLAGCVKLAISLYRKKFPPIINYSIPNPQIDFENSPFYVLDQATSWSEDEYPKRAALSSFGIGGTNTHAILEEYTRPISIDSNDDGLHHPIPLSAQRADVLVEYAQKLLAFLQNGELIHQIKLSEIAHTLQTGRKAMKYRVIFVVKDLQELTIELQHFTENIKSEKVFQGNADAYKEPADSIEEDEDYQELITHWFAKRKVKKLAQLWVNGTALNWKLLYNEKYPLRVSLPTYPFAKVPFWIEASSDEKINKTAALHPLLHTNISNFDSQSYCSIFSGKEYFLADHQINEQKVFPAAAYLEMASAAIMKAAVKTSESKVLSLHNIIWVQPLRVMEAKQVTINLSVDDGGQVGFQIISNDAEQIAIHCEGHAEFISSPLMDKLDIALLRQQMDGQSNNLSELYKIFNDLGTYYGPAHRSVQCIWKGQQQLLAQLSLPKVVYTTFNEYLLHPSLLDGVLQASNILFRDFTEQFEQDALPFALDSIAIRSQLSEELFAWVRLVPGSKPADKLLKMDVDLCDQAGNIEVTIRGLSFRSIADRNSFTATPDQSVVHLSTPFWHHAPIADAVENKRMKDHGDVFQQHRLILYGLPDIHMEQLKDLLPESECKKITKKHDNIATRFSETALLCFEEIRAIFKSKVKGRVLIQFVLPNSDEDDVFVGLSGLFKTASLENPQFTGQIIQIDEQTTTVQLAQTLLDNKQTTNELLIKYIQSDRHVLRWQPHEARQLQPKITLKDQGVYLITGGLGGLGLLFAKEILQQINKGHVILIGRTRLTEEKTELLNTLVNQGNTIEYYDIDVNNTGQVKEFISSIIDKYRQINGIFHSAGSLSDNFILKKTSEEFNRVLAPKVEGCFNLDQACRNIDLDFMVLFSSDSALGSIGQADYAAANGFMDQFASYRNQLLSKGLRYGWTLSINWPYWKDGGMRMEKATLEMLRETTGMQPMTTKEGIQAFYQCLEMNCSQVLVSVKNSLSLLNASSSEPIHKQTEELRDLQVQATPFSVAENDAIYEQSLLEKTQLYLKKEFSTFFKLAPHQIHTDTSLDHYGIDSILTISITNHLEKTFGTLSKTLLFEYQSIADLAIYLTDTFEEKLINLFGSPVVQVKKINHQTFSAESASFPSGRFSRLNTAKLTDTISTRPLENNAKGDDLIAIIGISGRYPESFTIEEYWNNLREGKDCIIEVPKERWDWKAYYTEDRSKDGAHYSKWGGFISGVDEFDPKFFNISPKEAEMLDPQERLFLQHAWMAVEDAGYTRAGLQIPHQRKLPGQVGVYVGVMYNEYQLFGAEISQHGRRMAFANSTADVANRVSFFLNLHGPSFTVDTMCSSSLTSIHLACQDLKYGRTDMAIAGGVNVTIHPNKYLLLSSGQYISTTGHCHSFGVGGDGYIPGEGVGAVILKRLSDAEKNGDHIYGVIRGSALNHGGKPNGYTVPNPKAQADLITQVFEESFTNPRHISYLEAHGTGTPLGDPIEIAALTKAFYQNNPVSDDHRGFCMIGSVKSNIGHCESAAGIAGLTKILLQMKHQQIVPSLHSKVLNPNIDFEKTPFVVNQSLKNWEQPVVNGEQVPRMAGISSFGAGGANAHLIVEEYLPETESAIDNTTFAILLSAKTQEQLQQKVFDLAHFIRNEQKSINLASMAYTLQVGREAMEERLGFMVSSIDQLYDKLQHYLNAITKSENVNIDGVYLGRVKDHKESMLVISQDDDMKETIQKWIVNKKTEKLLNLWVKGLELNWEGLYSDNMPKRMSLPTYPFARERYWWNDTIKDGNLTPKQWLNKQVAAMLIHPLLHKNTSNLDQQSYCTIFNSEESYLKDYFNNGQKTLPAIALLEMARAAIEHALPTKVALNEISLYEVKWGRPVNVEKHKEVKIVLLPNNHNGHIAFEIFSDDKGEDVIHCQGHASVGDNTPAGLDLTVKQGKSGKRHVLSDIYLPANQQGVLNGCILHPHLLDVILDSFKDAFAKWGEPLSFPKTITSIRFFAAHQEKMQANLYFSEDIRQVDEHLSVDMDLCDAQGNVCIQIQGINWKKTDKSDKTNKLAEIQDAGSIVLAGSSAPSEEKDIHFLQDHSQISTEETLKKPANIYLSVSNEVSPEIFLAAEKPSIKLVNTNINKIQKISAIRFFNYSNGVYCIQINEVSLSDEVSSLFIQALSIIERSSTVKVLLIRGGTDNFLQGDRQQYNHAVETKLYESISRFPYPTIAIMQGNAGGAGFLLGALCDFMICNEQATYFYTNIQSGLYPTAPEYKLLKERFGITRTYDFLYFSTTAVGKELKEKGWNSIILSEQQIEPYVKRLTTALIEKPRTSLRLLKQHLARHIVALASKLIVVPPSSLTTDKPIVVKKKRDQVPSHKNITISTHDQDTLVIHISPVEDSYTIHECLKDLKTIFIKVNSTSHYKSIIIRSGYLEKTKTNEKQFDLESFLSLSNLILTSKIPVIAVLEAGSKGYLWLLSLVCDGCIYNSSANYTTFGITKSHALSNLSAMLFTHRFGRVLSKEMLFPGLSYTGAQLQQLVSALPVIGKEQVWSEALKIAEFWAKLPTSVLSAWKRDNAQPIQEEIDRLTGITLSNEAFEPLDSLVPIASVPLNSKVINASVDADGILLVKMQDYDHKNMFSEDLTQGIVELFGHITKSPIYKVVILTGFENYFASGGTKEDLLAIQEGKTKFTDTKFYHLAAACKIPVISAMQGHAIGAGWSFGMFADFILFSDESKYLSPYMDFGFTPGAGATFILPETIGYDLSRETLLTARDISGSELKERGLQLPVLPRQQVLSRAMTLAQQIAKHPRAQLLALKDQLTQGVHQRIDEVYELELLMHEKTFVGKAEMLERIQQHFAQTDGNAAEDITKPSAVSVYVEETPLLVNEKEITLSELTAHIKKFLAQELHMREEEINDNAQFIDLGLDSITGVTWVRKINEKYQLKIEAVKIYSFPTLAQFGQYIQDERAKQHKQVSPSVPNKGIHSPAATIAFDLDRKTSQPKAPEETNALPSVQATLKHYLAQELHMQDFEIAEDVQFIDLGVDSIIGVTWIRKINEKYHLSIEATKIYTYPTLLDFSRYLLTQIEKQEKTTSMEPLVDVETPTHPLIKIDSTFIGEKLGSWRKQFNSKANTGLSNKSYIQPIAIVGIAGQFPQASDIEAFWVNISQGKDCISKISKTRWDLDTYHKAGTPEPGKTNCEWQGSLDGYDLFDPLFFNISPSEAERIDPQQRLFLQSCWHAIENAGYNATTLSGTKCGVFAGAAIGDYQFLSRELQLTAKGFTGTANSILASRISYFLNLQGPCLTIDTACSSSLVAIATACDSLISGNSDMALAGGVCVMATPDLHIKASQSGMLSQDGKCYTFDNRANGFVPGEGVGVVMLKRLSDAQKDQDNILGVIQGWGVNQDGKTNGITAPNPEAQKRLIQDVYNKFGINPAQIQLVEAHGTGTKLGDPIEVAALIDSFKSYTDKKNYCAIGSVKSNIGHCMAAAGIASVMKSVMALKNKQIPPTINFERLNEHINLKDTPFYVNDRLQSLKNTNNEPFNIAISSFGFSGTNAHLVIAEYLPDGAIEHATLLNPEVIVPLSARDGERLNEKVEELLDYIRKHPSTNLHEMAYTLQIGREAMNNRLSFLANGVEQFSAKLQAYLNDEKFIEGVFSGQVNRGNEGFQFINQDHEIQKTLIDKWLTNGQLSKLAEAWTKGLHFDWNKLYGNMKPRRMVLPLYPFAKERYWIDGKSLQSQTPASTSLQLIHPLVHANTSNFSQQCYSSNFDGLEFFLKDHQVHLGSRQSQPDKILPGVAYLEMARAAIEDAMSFTGRPIMLELKNIIWVRPIAVTEKRQVRIGLLTNDSKHIDFEIFSLYNEEPIVHCKGQAILIDHLASEQIQIDHLAKEMNKGRIQAEDAYTRFREMGLFYGPAHQGIEVIDRGDDQVLAHLKLPESVEGINDKRFILHPSLMDSAIQAAIGFTEDLNNPPKNASLPFALERLRILEPCKNSMYSWVRYSANQKATDKLFKLDIDLMDELGKVCVQMRGLTSRTFHDESEQYDSKISKDVLHVELNIDESGSLFNEVFYEKLIQRISNNELSIDEAINLEER